MKGLNPWLAAGLVLVVIAGIGIFIWWQRKKDAAELVKLTVQVPPVDTTKKIDDTTNDYHAPGATVPDIEGATNGSVTPDQESAAIHNRQILNR